MCMMSGRGMQRLQAKADEGVTQGQVEPLSPKSLSQPLSNMGSNPWKNLVKECVELDCSHHVHSRHIISISSLCIIGKSNDPQ